MVIVYQTGLMRRIFLGILALVLPLCAANAASIRVLNRRPTDRVVMDSSTTSSNRGEAVPMYTEFDEKGLRLVRVIGQSFVLFSDAVSIEVTDLTLRLSRECNFTEKKASFDIVFMEDTDGDQIGDTQVGELDTTALYGVVGEEGQYVNFSLNKPVKLISGRFYSVELWYSEGFKQTFKKNSFRFARSENNSVYPWGHFLIAGGMRPRTNRLPVGNKMSENKTQDLDLVLRGNPSEQLREFPIDLAALTEAINSTPTAQEPIEATGQAFCQVLESRPKDRVLLNIEAPNLASKNATTYTTFEQHSSIGQSFAILNKKSERVEVTDITLRLLKPYQISGERIKLLILFKEDTTGDRLSDAIIGEIMEANLSELSAKANHYLNFSLEKPVTLLPNRLYSLEVNHIKIPSRGAEKYPPAFVVTSSNVYNLGYYLWSISPSFFEPLNLNATKDLDLVLRGHTLNQTNAVAITVPGTGTASEEQQNIDQPEGNTWNHPIVYLLAVILITLSLFALAYTLRNG